MRYVTTLVPQRPNNSLARVLLCPAQVNTLADMPVNSLDAYIGVHASALRISAQRTELIANNLANADTPNFKARDLDFRRALSAAENNVSGSGPAGSALQYRVPLAPSLDGNTVEVQVEQANFAQNAVRYQATLSFLSAKFRGLMTALTGQ